MKHLTWFFIALTILVFLMITPIRVATANSGSGFTISMVANNSEESSYVKYHLKPADRKKFSIEVKNTDDKTHKYEVSVVSAGTTTSGSISYAKDSDVVNIFQPRMPQLVTANQNAITIPTKGSHTIDFTVTSPEKGISGDVLGAIHVKKVAKRENAGALGLQNSFAMSLPIHLYADDQRTVMPKLSLKDSKLIKSGTKTIVTSRLSNAAARFFGEITIKTEVVSASSGKKIAATKLTDAEMAPGAAMKHDIPLKVTSLAPGKYYVKTNLSSGEKVYKLSDSFTIKRKDLAVTTITPEKNDRSMLWLIAILLVIILLLILVLVLMRRKLKGAE